MKLSKEFIEAMNGVLNGEKWTRKVYYLDGELRRYYKLDICNNIIGKYMHPSALIFIEDNNSKLTLGQMTATDWEKVTN